VAPAASADRDKVEIQQEELQISPFAAAQVPGPEVSAVFLEFPRSHLGRDLSVLSTIEGLEFVLCVAYVTSEGLSTRSVSEMPVCSQLKGPECTCVVHLSCLHLMSLVGERCGCITHSKWALCEYDLFELFACEEPCG
jgi:hypothetical protein